MPGSLTALFSRLNRGGLYTVVNKSAFPGSIFWVDNSNAGALNSTSYGDNPYDRPLSTLDYAIGLVTAAKGDVIICMPGHAETLASTDVTFDKQDMEVIGLGQGSNKPLFTFTATTDEFNTTADDVTIKGIRFLSGVNNLAHFIDSDGEHLTIEDCDFETVAGAEAYAFINFATTKDYLTIRRCNALQPSDPAGTTTGDGTGFLYCVDSEHILIEDCKIIGSYETAIVHNKTTKCLDLIIRNCSLNQQLADGLHLILVADVTGVMERTTGRNINATDVTLAKLVGTIGTKFWLGAGTAFGNDSGGGQAMVAGDAAAT